MAIENRGPTLTAVCWVFLASAVIAVSLRCYVRLYLVKNFGRDDWMMVAALASFAILITFTLLGVHYGTGRHYWDLSNSDIEQALKWWYHCYLWYCITVVTCKLSIAFFLLRIAVRRVDRVIIYTATGVTVVTSIIFFFCVMLQCKPVSYFWDKDQEGTCISVDTVKGLTYGYSAFSVVCDFTFTLLPISLVMRLNMDRRSKLALIPIMSVACVASAAVVIRLPYVKDFDNPDFLYATLDIAIWSTAEGGLGITAGSVATLRPLLRQITYKLGLSMSGQTKLEDGNQQYSLSKQRGQTPNPRTAITVDQVFTLQNTSRHDEDDNRTDGSSSTNVDYSGTRRGGWVNTARGDQPHGSEEQLAVL